MEIKMGRWRNFLDSLDTDGGHIFAMFGLLVIGLVFYAKVDATSGGTIVIGTFSALLVLLKTKGTNSEQIARAGSPYQLPQPPQPPASGPSPAPDGGGVPATPGSPAAPASAEAVITVAGRRTE